MSDRILVPVDGSPLSKHALEVACEEYPDAEIFALHVIDPTEPGYSIFDVDWDTVTEPRHGSDEWYDQAESLADELFEAVSEIADAHDVTVHTETVHGRPDRVILEFVEDEDIDHVIVGSHGREEDSRILLGSVTEAIAFRAPVRVSLIR